jgi:hypothetical protein
MVARYVTPGVTTTLEGSVTARTLLTPGSKGPCAEKTFVVELAFPK